MRRGAKKKLTLCYKRCLSPCASHQWKNCTQLSADACDLDSPSKLANGEALASMKCSIAGKCPWAMLADHINMCMFAWLDKMIQLGCHRRQRQLPLQRSLRRVKKAILTFWLLLMRSIAYAVAPSHSTLTVQLGRMSMPACLLELLAHNCLPF